ncbi:MAG: oxidoreductase, partial [Pusillimonas sp.]
MNYRNNPESVRALIRPTEVHKDIFVDDEIFDLEMEHLFANTWIYVGHASQVPKPGDFYTTTVGDQPVIMVRDNDNTVKVINNRCPHKGVEVAPPGCGNTGKFFRCPYHAWSFRLDGSLLALPLKRGYDPEVFNECEACHGMAGVTNVRNYRDFIFCRLNPEGQS